VTVTGAGDLSSQHTKEEMKSDWGNLCCSDGCGYGLCVCRRRFCQGVVVYQLALQLMIIIATHNTVT